MFVLSSTRLAVLACFLLITYESFAQTVTLTPAPVFKDELGVVSAKIIGFGQADIAIQDNDSVDHPSGSTIRRARLGVAGKIDTQWGYKFLHEFGNNNSPSLQDLFITHKNQNGATVKFGQFKEPVGLEWQSGSPNWTFLDLPLSHSIAVGRAVGVARQQYFGGLRVNAGLFGENSNKTRTDTEAVSTTVHSSYQFKKQGGHAHIGLSLSYRLPDEESESLAFKSKHETATTVSPSLNSTVAEVDSSTLVGLEGLWISGPILIQGEWLQRAISRQTGSEDTDVSAWYITGSYTLDGTRGFNSAKHGFKKTTAGAVEVALRIESLDLDDDAIAGGTLDRHTLGVNWYAHKAIRMSLNIISVNTNSRAAIPNDSSKAMVFRGQFAF